jgi:hypothetical protein
MSEIVKFRICHVTLLNKTLNIECTGTRKCYYSEKNVQNPPRISIRWYLPVGTGPDVPFLKSSVWRILQENTHFIVNSTGTSSF